MSAPKEFELHIHLNLGQANGVMYAADLTGEYVDFNKGDVGDSGSLCGWLLATDETRIEHRFRKIILQ